MINRNCDVIFCSYTYNAKKKAAICNSVQLSPIPTVAWWAHRCWAFRFRCVSGDQKKKKKEKKSAVQNLQTSGHSVARPISVNYSPDTFFSPSWRNSWALQQMKWNALGQLLPSFYTTLTLRQDSTTQQGIRALLYLSLSRTKSS